MSPFFCTLSAMSGGRISRRVVAAKRFIELFLIGPRGRSAYLANAIAIVTKYWNRAYFWPNHIHNIWNEIWCVILTWQRQSHRWCGWECPGSLCSCPERERENIKWGEEGNLRCEMNQTLRSSIFGEHHWHQGHFHILPSCFILWKSGKTSIEKKVVFRALPE